MRTFLAGSQKVLDVQSQAYFPVVSRRSYRSKSVSNELEPPQL